MADIQVKDQGLVDAFGSKENAQQFGAIAQAALATPQGQLATQQVQHYATHESKQDLTNVQKREGAISDLKQAAISQGLSIGEGLATMLIQMAFTFFAGKLKAKATPAAPLTDQADDQQPPQ